MTRAEQDFAQRAEAAANFEHGAHRQGVDLQLGEIQSEQVIQHRPAVAPAVEFELRTRLTDAAFADSTRMR